jgi:hypothetical protein
MEDEECIITEISFLEYKKLVLKAWDDLPDDCPIPKFESVFSELRRMRNNYRDEVREHAKKCCEEK